MYCNTIRYSQFVELYAICSSIYNESIVDMEEPIPQIDRNILLKLFHNPKKSAKAIDLIYVNDSLPGIIRKRWGSRFTYQYEGNTIKDKKELHRIRKLAIPPAWENVWICKLENGHIQVTGFDAKKRKQYRYHSSWSQLRNGTKFWHLWQFGQVLPKLRAQIHHDLSLPGLPQEKIVATVIRLMERTNIRIGNGNYEKLYGSYGITTLKNSHLQSQGTIMKFHFRGKKGIFHDISVRNKKLANIVKQCKEIPRKELFQYHEDGQYKSIESGMVNKYIQQTCGEGFSAKDIRTWNGTLQALFCLKEMGAATDSSSIKKNIVHALDDVSHFLGNTRNVCKKYYVHPLILSLYKSGRLSVYTQKCQTTASPWLSEEECLLLHILENEQYP